MGKDMDERAPMTDTREALDPRFEELARERSELVWNLAYAELWIPDRVESSRAELNQWERSHADEWNQVKPWFEQRLTKS